MNLSRCFAPRQLLFLLAAALITTGERHALSQETITFRDGHTQQVNILGVNASGIRVQTQQGQLVEPFFQITAVSMPAPPDYTAAVAAYEHGDLQRALTLDQAVVASYRQLPTDWAEEAMLMLGDIYVGLGQLPQAERAYRDFEKVYPGAGKAAVDVGLARIDIANKDYTTARAKITPVLDQALKTRNVPAATGALIGRAFFVSGQIKAQSGDLPGALEDYLRTVTIFPQDRVAAASAEQQANLLRKEHGTTVP